MSNRLPILDLVLKQKPYLMIYEGIKLEEYREIKPYWQKRFEKFGEKPLLVRLRFGYTSKSFLMFCDRIRTGSPRPEWVCDQNIPERCFVLRIKPPSADDLEAINQ
nr:MAG TPA: hypothetical protein [Caudoviricetes sp.]